ncbi:MAG TPA: DEAD/DEAH box helicase [Gemmatimonadaceae bacterium]|nr:DEAD/DEAH box helicase [Gemmatimonadaceae bacterium]
MEQSMDRSMEPHVEQPEEQRADSDGDGGFAALGLSEPIVEALHALGYEEPTPIQREAIPPLLEGHDLLGLAATGTGKTAAFALPLLERIGPRSGRRDGVCALILVPTRELAMQVAEAVHKYGKGLGTRVLAVYGGQPISQQLRVLGRGVDVVVATPGRALDHLRRGSLDASGVQVVVLDEADEMLDMGFAEDLEAILEGMPEERQSALFSATMAPRVAGIAERHLKDPVRVTVARETAAPGEVPRVRQVAYVVRREHKPTALGRVLDMENPTSAIVFCRTRTEVDSLTETLAGRGWAAEALHGGLSQEQRDRVMRRFRDGATELLVATDVAARGLDIEHVSHVVNYDVPSAPDAYVHRIGRTGRAGREGVAITLAEPREHRLLRNIEQATRQRIPVEAVPTAVDLRARRMELTRAALRESLLEGELDQYRQVLEALTDEFDVMDIALAAVKLAHEAEGDGASDEEEEIPAATFPERGGSRDRFRDRGAGRERGPREHGPRERREWSGEERGGPARGEGRRERFAGRGDEGEERRPPRRGAARGRGPGGDTVRLYVGLGRKAGVRPGDLVGAIANEAGVDSRAIGAIEITDRFSLVEVPDEAAETIVRALRGTTIRGKRVMVRRDRDAY